MIHNIRLADLLNFFVSWGISLKMSILTFLVSTIYLLRPQNWCWVSNWIAAILMRNCIIRSHKCIFLQPTAIKRVKGLIYTSNFTTSAIKMDWLQLFLLPTFWDIIWLDFKVRVVVLQEYEVAPSCSMATWFLFLVMKET